MTDFVMVPVRRGLYEITPLLKMISGLGFVAGGYVRYMASPLTSPVPADDVDVFAYTADAWQRLRHELRGHLLVQHESKWAVSYAPSTYGGLGYVPKVQLIKPIREGRAVSWGTEGEIIANFDLTIVRCALIAGPRDYFVLADPDFINDELSQRLSLRNIHCPISSMLRCIKYAKRGYSIRSSDILPLFLDWDGRDDEYRGEIIRVLGQQLEFERTGNNEPSEEDRTAIYQLMSVD